MPVYSVPELVYAHFLWLQNARALRARPQPARKTKDYSLKSSESHLAVRSKTPLPRTWQVEHSRVPVPLHARHVAWPRSKREAAPYSSSLMRSVKPLLDDAYSASKALQPTVESCTRLRRFRGLTSELSVAASCARRAARVAQPPWNPASRKSRLRRAAALTLLQGDAPARNARSIGRGSSGRVRGSACIIMPHPLQASSVQRHAVSNLLPHFFQLVRYKDRITDQHLPMGCSLPAIIWVIQGHGGLPRGAPGTCAQVGHLGACPCTSKCGFLPVAVGLLVWRKGLPMEANSNSTRPAGVAEGRQPSVERALSHGGLPRIGSTESQQHNGPAGDHPRKRLPAKQTSRSFSDLSRCGHRLAAAAGTQKLSERSGAVRPRPRWVRADLGSQQAGSCCAPPETFWSPRVALRAVRRRALLRKAPPGCALRAICICVGPPSAVLAVLCRLPVCAGR